MIFLIVLLLYASFSPNHTPLDIPKAFHTRFAGLMTQVVKKTRIKEVSEMIEIINTIDDIPRPGDIALVPGYHQYLITDRDGFNVNVYQDHTFVHAINIEIEDTELFAYGGHYGFWDIVFDNDFNGTTNKTIYMSLGTASPDLFGPNEERIGIHTVVRAEYDPATMQIIGLEGGDLRKPPNLCANCYTTEETRVPMPIFDERPQDIPELSASNIIFHSTRDPKFFLDVEHYRGQPQRGEKVRFAESSSGGKLLVLPDNTLLFSIGYAHQKLVSQDLTLFDGKIIRMTRDGQPVCDIANIEDNPFCDSDHPVTRYIYSYGHKNNQGIAIDPYGRIFASEHGEQGGDEVNRIYAGENYGFPYFVFGGKAYLGDGMGRYYPAPDSIRDIDSVAPLFLWNYIAKSAAPAGIRYYDHDNQYKDSLLVATLARKEVTRIEIDRNGNPIFAEPIIAGCRFRDVEIDVEGLLYFLTDNCGELIVAEVVDMQ